MLGQNRADLPQVCLQNFNAGRKRIAADALLRCLAGQRLQLQPGDPAVRRAVIFPLPQPRSAMRIAWPKVRKFATRTESVLMRKQSSGWRIRIPLCSCSKYAIRPPSRVERKWFSNGNTRNEPMRNAIAT